MLDYTRWKFAHTTSQMHHMLGQSRTKCPQCTVRCYYHFCFVWNGIQISIKAGSIFALTTVAFSELQKVTDDFSLRSYSTQIQTLKQQKKTFPPHCLFLCHAKSCQQMQIRSGLQSEYTYSGKEFCWRSHLIFYIHVLF